MGMNFVDFGWRNVVNLNYNSKIISPPVQINLNDSCLNFGLSIAFNNNFTHSQDCKLN